MPESISANFLNVLELHYDQNPNSRVSTLDELLMANELELIQSETKAKTDGASLVRILNRMIRTFKTSKTGGSGQGSMIMTNYNESTEESKMEVKRGRSHSPDHENCKSIFKYQKNSNLINFILNENIDTSQA